MCVCADNVRRVCSIKPTAGVTATPSCVHLRPCVFVSLPSPSSPPSYPLLASRARQNRSDIRLTTAAKAGVYTADTSRLHDMGAAIAAAAAVAVAAAQLQREGEGAGLGGRGGGVLGLGADLWGV